MPKVYTGGTFDIFHAGHVNFLKQCKNIARNGKVIVCLNTDEFIEEYKGSKPIYSYQDRKEILDSCVYVDKVIKNIGGKNSKPTILKAKPDFIVIGDDWSKKDYYKQMNFTQEWLDEQGIVLIYVPYKQGISSTIIKEKCKNLK